MPPSTPVAGDVAVHADPAPLLSYAMAHSAVPFLDRVRLANGGPERRGAVVGIEVADAQGALSQPWERVVDLGAGDDTLLTDVRPRLDAGAMLQVEEQRPATITVTVSHERRVIARSQHPTTLLAAHQWLASPPQLGAELLASFVQPNHPAITDLLGQASDVLLDRTGSGALQGYQAGSERADAIAGAVWEAVQARGVRYASPPASWADVGQKIRTPAEVLQGRVGTCLDTVVVMAAALEQAGLHPLVWLTRDHAFLGYWREEGVHLPETARRDAGSLVNMVDLDVVRLVETTLVTEREVPVAFADSHRPPHRDHLSGDAGSDGRGGSGGVVAVIDVVMARRSGIVPLPARTRGQDGAVTIVEYRPAEHSSPAALAPAGATGSAGSAGPGAGPARAPTPPRVQRWKNALLDLSLRNHLINYRDQGVRLVVPQGRLGAVEDTVTAGHALSLVPSDAFDQVQHERGAATAADLPQHVLADALDARRVFTDLTGATYPRRLQDLAYKARTIVEETGANNLYLALGSLRWDVEGHDVRSPLVLVPVRLRTTARGSSYRLEIDESGAPTPNFCLLEKLRQLHGLSVPGLAEPVEEGSGIDLDAALTAVRTALADAGLPFRVEATADLAILRFAKFRLWKDLDEHWEALSANPLVDHLVRSPTDPFVDPAEPKGPSETDDTLGAGDLDALAAACPVPADAAQLAAVQAAVAGRTFVLEGPPGTGKSQTITNLLARCLAEGRRVLFVAEKRAALDVVRSRLAEVGMAPFSLDLHDRASRPTAVRAQVRAALEHAVEVDEQGLAVEVEDLGAARRTLSRYAERLHETNGAGLSLYGARTALLAMGDGPTLPVPRRLLAGDGEEIVRVRRALRTLPDTADAARPSPSHPWRWLGRRSPDALDVAAVWRTATALDHAVSALPDAGPASDLAHSAASPAQLRAAAVIATGEAHPIALLDTTRTPAWRERSRSVIDDARELSATPHPVLAQVSAVVFTLPLADLAAQAADAAASGFFGRKKRLLAVLDRLRPGLDARAEIAPRDLSSVLDALARLQEQVASLTGRARAVDGLTVPPGWDPLVPAQRAVLESQVRALTAAGRAVDPSGAFAPSLRRYAGARAAGADPAARTLTGAADAAGAFAAATGLDDADLTEPDGLVAAWQDGAAARDLDDERRWSLRSYVAVLETLEPLRAAGMDQAHALLRAGAVPAEDAARAFDRGLATESLAERSATTGLDAFSRPGQDRAVERFTASSRSVRDQMRHELPRQVLGARPFQASTGRGRVGELARELAKQRRGLGVRALMSRYGDLITQVMPCVLVSPDSLARFFPPEPGLFDVVVFDEASQIRVADAVGAMGRARSVVVVGDSRQMPPTSFGEAGLLHDGADDEDAGAAEFAVVEDQESILSEATLARVPSRWLSWHYRSQDESLIAFSNRHYYEDRLSSFPAPTDASGGGAGSGDRGISLVRVDGRFHRSGERGLLRTNPVEARAVVAEIRRRFDASPGATPSLGVVTFNAQQRTLVERLLLESGDERLVAALQGSEEGLFVKNLENVQGDERDTVLFSTAFSVDARGVLPLNFGPLNRGGGERRLNVAVTRARRQVVVFSSFDPEQLRAEETSSVGIKHLRAYLDLAAHGPASLGQGARRLAVVDRHRDEVAAALRARGLVVRTDVGLSDFKVDLSVAAADAPDRPLVAVLLDGPGWARRRTVGDRDGMPREVLSGLMRWPGVERVWMPAWLADPDAVVGRLVDALHAASVPPPDVPAPVDASPPTDVTPPTDVPAPVEVPALEAMPDAEPAAPPPLMDGESVFVAWEPGTLGPRVTLDRLTGPYDRRLVVRALEQGVAAEGPVHLERLARLVAGGFGLKRVSTERVESVLALLPAALRARVDDGFVWPLEQDPDAWTGFRRAAQGQARPVEEVSLREIGNAMVALCAVSGGIERDELCREALAVLGGKRLTPAVAPRVQAAVDLALAQQRLAPGPGGALAATL